MKKVSPQLRHWIILAAGHLILYCIVVAVAGAWQIRGVGADVRFYHLAFLFVWLTAVGLGWPANARSLIRAVGFGAIMAWLIAMVVVLVGQVMTSQGSFVEVFTLDPLGAIGVIAVAAPLRLGALAFGVLAGAFSHLVSRSPAASP